MIRNDTLPDNIFRPAANSGRLWAALSAAYEKGTPDVDMNELFKLTGRTLTYSVQEYFGYRFSDMNRSLARNNSAFRIKPGRLKGSYAITRIR